MTQESAYTGFFKRLQTNEVNTNLESSDVSVALLDVGHTPDTELHETFADVSSDEIVNTTANDTGYTVGGKLLSSVSITTSGSQVYFDAGDVEWNPSTISAGYAVVYHSAPSQESDQDLIFLVDFEEEKRTEDAAFRIVWNQNGIFRVDTS